MLLGQYEVPQRQKVVAVIVWKGWGLFFLLHLVHTSSADMNINLVLMLPSLLLELLFCKLYFSKSLPPGREQLQSSQTASTTHLEGLIILQRERM